MPHASPLLHRLPNGVTVLALPMPHLASASVTVHVRAGSRDERAERAGLSHFLEHMAFKGTRSRSVQAINLAAESLGADMNADTDKDATCYFLEGLAEHVPQMLELLADLVLDSTFPEAELEREREVILQEATEHDEDPQQLSYTLLDQALWGEHPLARPIIGTAETIAAIARDDLVAHVAEHYTADRIVVGCAGRVDPEAFLALAERLFGAARPASGAWSAAAHAPPRALGQVRNQRLPGVSQAYVLLGWPAASRGEHPQLASLLSTLFGGGMSAPLVDAVRERLGLAYSVGASAEVGDVHGSFLVDAITTPDKLPAFTQAVAELLARQVEATSSTDLERARNQLAVGLVRGAERPLRALRHAVEQLWATGRIPSLEESIAQLHAVDGAAVRAAFAAMLAQPPATVLVGAGATAKAAREMQGRLRVG